MASALSTLLNYSKAKLSVDKDMTVPAFFDEGSRELVINSEFPDEEAFASIAAEVALTRYHDKGYNRDYSWARYELDAQSVSYILCRRFGIEPKEPNMERLAERFSGMDPEESKTVLDKIQNMSKQIGRSIDMNIEAEKRRHAPPCGARCGEPFCRGVFPCGEYEPCSSPCQGRMIAGAITREPASLRTGRTLTGAVPQLMRQPRGKLP